MAPFARQRDYTDGNLLANIWHLSWPNIVSMAFLNVPSLLSVLWLGRLSTEALAAAGIGMALRVTLISPLMALSAASGAVVARHVGAKNQDLANAAVLQGVVLFFVAALSIGLVTLVFLRLLLNLAGATGELLPLAMRYTRVLMIGLVAMEMVPSVGAMITSAGSPHLSMRVNLLASGTRAMLEPFLVLGIGSWVGLGITGAALALVTGNVLGMIYALYLLVTRQAAAWIDLSHLRLDWGIIQRIIKLALPAVVQKAMPNLAQNLLLRLISPFGAVPLAAYNVLRTVFNMALIPCMGIGGSASPLVGQNLGAERPHRATRSLVYIGRLILALGAIVVGLVIAFRPAILQLFTKDAGVLANSQMAAILGVGMLLYVFGQSYENGLTGAGDTVSPMVINLVVLWVVQLPVTWLLSQALGFAADGIWWGIAFSQLCYAGLLYARFQQGRWKLIRL